MALNVLVLGPLATWAVYALAARIAGVGAGLWCAALWVIAPYAAIPLFVDRYHERYVEQFLPQALGLTQLADYPSMVLLLAFGRRSLARALEPGRLHEAIAAGLLAGYAAGVKPANYLFLAGAGAAFVLARRWREARCLRPRAAFPRGRRARLEGEGARARAGPGGGGRGRRRPSPRCSTASTRSTGTPGGRTCPGLREYFWSARLLQWAPLAGTVAVARRSLPGGRPARRLALRVRPRQGLGAGRDGRLRAASSAC